MPSTSGAAAEPSVSRDASGWCSTLSAASRRARTPPASEGPARFVTSSSTDRWSLREDLCYSSGELVARALERGGFIWEHDPAQVTPADIFRRYRQPESVRSDSLTLTNPRGS